MATEEPRTSSVVRVRVELVIAPALAEPDVRVAQVEPEDPVVRVVRAALVVPEDPVVPAARAALVVPESPVVLAAWAVLVAPGDPVGLAASVVPESPVVLELAPAEAREPEIVQGAPVPERDPAAVLLKTKSAIAAHPRGRVQVLRAGDLAAEVVETTHEPAATEAAAAWAAAG